MKILLAILGILSQYINTSDCGFNPLRLYFPDLKMTDSRVNSTSTFCPMIADRMICCHGDTFDQIPTLIRGRYDTWIDTAKEIYNMFKNWRDMYLRHSMILSTYTTLMPIIDKRLKS